MSAAASASAEPEPEPEPPTPPPSEIELEVNRCIRYGLSKATSTDGIFESIIDRVRVYYEKPAGNIAEFRRRKTKTKGDVFEVFCRAYLRALKLKSADTEVLKYTDVWLLNDIPADVKLSLGLRNNRDVGIDLVARDGTGKFYAIQAKYRRKSPTRPKNVLGWKQLSTFYALCMRTGPWVKYVVMTNCDYVARNGHKQAKDWTMNYNTFQKTSRAMWDCMVGYNSGAQPVGNSLLPPPSLQVPESESGFVTMPEDTAARKRKRKTKSSNMVVVPDPKSLRELRTNYFAKRLCLGTAAAAADTQSPQ